MPTTDKSVLLPFKVHKILKMKATKAEVSMKEYLIRAITKGDDANVVDTEKP